MSVYIPQVHLRSSFEGKDEGNLGTIYCIQKNKKINLDTHVLAYRQAGLILFYKMKKNSIIFLDLNYIHFTPIIQLNNSSISHLTSTFCIKWRSIKYQYSLSACPESVGVDFKIFEQIHFFRR